MIKTLARNNLKTLALALLFVAACMPKGVGVKDPSFAYDDEEEETPAAEVAKPALALAADGAAVLPAVPSANLAVLDDGTKAKVNNALEKIEGALGALKDNAVKSDATIDDAKKKLQEVWDSLKNHTK